LTFNRETELIWKQRWSLVTVLFLITRYLPFVDTIAMLLDLRSSGLGASDPVCLLIYHIQTFTVIVGLGASEGILIVRTAAVWGNSKRVFWALVILAVSIAGADCVLEGKWIMTVPSVGSSISINGLILKFGCPVPVQSIEPYLAAPWILLLGFETVLICLMVPKAVSQRILSKTPTYKVVFVTGVQFYVLSFVISLANIVIILSPFSTVVHTVLVQSFDRILHAILAERLVLSIRGTLSAHPQPASTISVMEFYGARISSRERQTEEP